MNYGMWKENTEALVKEIDPTVKVDRNFIYGYTDATLMASLVYRSLAALTMEYYIVVFAEDRLLLLEVSMGGELTGNHGEVLYSDIESFKVKKGFLQYVLSIKLKGEKTVLKLKCNHKMMNAEKMGMGWQKENLEFLSGNEWMGLA